MIRLLGIVVAMSLSVSGVSASPAAKAPQDYKGYEIPQYTVLETDGSFEIRRYGSRLVAEVEVEGDRSEAADKGFRLLADYIFGENVSRKEVAMTSPVTQTQTREAIPMTSPVTQSATVQDRWLVQFGMPRSYTPDTLPTPTNNAIRFTLLPEHKALAYRFSGFWKDRTFKEARAELMAYVAVKGLTPVGTPVFAYYDDPFTAPWNRRNEVLQEIQ